MLLDLVAPVFLIVAAGWLAAARGWIAAGGFRGLNAFAFTLASPALLFVGGTTGPGGGGGGALAFFLATAALYAAVLVGARLRGEALGAAGLLALDTTFGNTVMMGIPIVTAAFGPAALPPLLAILALHSMLLLGTATAVAEVGLQARAPLGRVVWATLRGVARNPIVMAVLASLVWRLLGLPPPPVAIRRTLEILGAAAPPVALFCLGGSLAGFKLAGAWPGAVGVSVLKLLLHPALVWGACVALGVGALETAVAVTMAALPTGANAYLLASRYRIGVARSGAAVLVGTAASLATLPLLLGWLRPG